jgi:hypothetical protein
MNSQEALENIIKTMQTEDEDVSYKKNNKIT